MPLDRQENMFQKFLTDMMQFFSADILKHFADNMLEQSFSEISRKSRNAFVVFSSFAYFSTDSIPIDIIASVMNKDDTQAVVEIGKNFLLLDPSNDQNFINVNKQAQRKIRASLEISGREKLILKSVLELLINIGKNEEKFSLLVEHAICVWLHAYNSDEHLKASCALPNYIVTSLIKQFKYKKANSFGWKALKVLKAVLGEDHAEVLKLQFQLGSLLQMMDKYKPALRLLMGLFDKDIKDTELKMNIKLAVISVTKKIQDNFQYYEILPVYEKLLSKEKIGVTKDEAILKAWHHYALLLMNLDRSDNFLEISNDILKQNKMPLKKETKFYFINNMANAFLGQGNYPKALDLFKELLEQKKIIFGEDHSEILKVKCSIATALQKLNKENEYITLLEEIVKQYDTINGKFDPEIISVKERLALAYYNKNECKKAAELFKVVCQSHKATLKENTNEILTMKQNLSPILIGDNIHPDQIKNFTAEINENSALKPVNISVMKKNMEMLCLISSNSILSMAKESDVGKVYEVVQQNDCDINASDDLGNTPLHYASQFGNTSVVKLLLDFGAMYIAKNKKGEIPLQVADNTDIKVLLITVEKLFRNVKLGNFVEVKKCIQQQRCIVNAKDNDGHHPLHWAASNGHISVVKLLLETGADPTYVTNKGNTPLHIAVSKGFLVITEVLLQFIKCDELDNFVNAQTLGTGATSLHVAAKKGFKDIVKILLKHGAVYNMKNNEDKTALELFEDKTSDSILKLTKELFEDAVVGNPSIVNKLRKMPSSDMTAIANACNIEGCTLMEVMINNNHKTLAFDCLQILKNLHDLKPWNSYPKTIPETKSSANPDPELLRVEGTLQQIKSFQKLATEHLAFSDPFILNLQYFCNLGSHLSEINPCPSRTFRDGICYLQNIHNLVKEYKISYPNWTENVNIKQINSTLDYLEFAPEPNPENPSQYSVKADAKFQSLLHSELKKDLRLFIDLVEINIEIPIIRFLQSLTSQLCSFYSEALFKAIESNNRLIVEKYVKEDRAILNINTDGISPLHCAINHASFKIIKILIENGADTLQKVDSGDTLLHLTACKGLKGSVELLLKHTYPDQLKKLVDAKNKTEGDTALHLAAKNGFILILKSLLKYGACYCLKNKQGKMPIDLATKHSNIRDLLKLISQLFKYAEGENFEFGNIIRSVHPEDLMAATNARNELGLSLLEVIKFKHIRQIPDNMLGMMMGFGSSALYCPISYDQTSYERICKIAHAFSRYSELYLSKLRYKAQIYPDDAGKNPSPFSTLKEGSLYLNNVSRFIEECKTCVGSANNTNFLKMKETLAELQFDPSHIISEARDCVIRSFISQGQGSKYYKLLHSKLKKDILEFIYIVEKGIETPALHFLAELKCLIVTAEPGIF